MIDEDPRDRSMYCLQLYLQVSETFLPPQTVMLSSST